MSIATKPRWTVVRPSRIAWARKFWTEEAAWYCILAPYKTAQNYKPEKERLDWFGLVEKAKRDGWKVERN